MQARHAPCTLICCSCAVTNLHDEGQFNLLNSFHFGAITNCVDDLCPSVTDLFSPADFWPLHLTSHKLVFSALLAREDNGEKAQFKTLFGSFFWPLRYRLSVRNAVEFRNRPYISNQPQYGNSSHINIITLRTCLAKIIISILLHIRTYLGYNSVRCSYHWDSCKRMLVETAKLTPSAI